MTEHVVNKALSRQIQYPFVETIYQNVVLCVALHVDVFDMPWDLNKKSFN